MKEIRDLLKPDFTISVPSKSEKGVYHKVEYNKVIGWRCSCVSYKKECRHIRICQNKLQGNYAEDY